MTFEDHVLQVQVSGYTLLPGLLSREECAAGRRELDRIMEAERDLPGVPHGPHGGWAYNLMNKAEVFERLYQVPELLRLVRHFLGDDAVISGIMGRKVLPGAPVQGLHFDGSLTGPFRSNAPADDQSRSVSQVFGMNVIWCLSDFTPRNGATRLVPGTHRLPGREVRREGPVPGEVVVEAEQGTALVFNIATWHGQSAHTGTEPRYAALTPWRRSWLRPEVDLSRMVRPDVLERAGPQGRTIFGFQSRPPYVERWQWDTQTGRPKPEWEPG